MPREWTTRAPVEWSRQYGVEESHGVFFVPVEDVDGPRTTYSISVPEASWHQCVKALRRALDDRARVLIVCDTSVQATLAAGVAETALGPTYRRLSFEAAQAGHFGKEH